MEIGIFNETNEVISELEIIKKLMEFVVLKEKVDNAVFNIIIIDNKRIREINKEYRNIDKETDVISFALEDEQDFLYEEFRLLGDIYISLDKVKEQSKMYGHSFLRELAFLSVHGILHLLGYDHIKSEDEAIMFAKQDEILNEFGIKR